MSLLDRKDIADLNYEFRKLRKEVDAMKVDAARYQWVREHPAFESEAWLGSCTQAEYDERVDQGRGV